ncbi:hypothetical protein AKG09_06865 [Neisseria sp. 83E34]|nr:hypothetical protein AKG09_06865 [Neisseria sp. 83E34]
MKILPLRVILAIITPVQESVTSDYTVTAEGADTLKSLRQKDCIYHKHLESGAAAPTEGEKAFECFKPAENLRLKDR